MPQNRKFKNQDDYSWSDFRRNLRTLLDSKNYNCKEFALSIGLNPTTVSRYLTTRSPDLTSLWRIADYWGVSMDWLLGRESEDLSFLTDEARRVASLYSAASDDDRRVIDLILEKYDNGSKGQ